MLQIGDNSCSCSNKNGGFTSTISTTKCSFEMLIYFGTQKKSSFLSHSKMIRHVMIRDVEITLLHQSIPVPKFFFFFKYLTFRALKTQTQWPHQCQTMSSKVMKWHRGNGKTNTWSAYSTCARVVSSAASDGMLTVHCDHFSTGLCLRRSPRCSSLFRRCWGSKATWRWRWPPGFPRR